MKVILQKDVPKIGKKYEVKEVSSGYALNFLIPHGAAKPATPDALSKLSALKAEIDAERKIQADLLLKNLEGVDGKEVIIKVKANDKGHLFASLHAHEVIKAIKDVTGADIPEDIINVPNHIKEVGTYDLDIKAHDKKAKIKLVVEGK